VKLGYLRDRPKQPWEDPDWSFTAFAAGRFGAPPPADDLSSLVVDVLDQGNLGSCVLNSAFQAIRMRHVAQGVHAPKLGSRLMGYYLARAVDHLTAVDSGTYLRTAFEVLNKFGFCSEDVWPYNDGPELFMRMPNSKAFHDAFDLHAPTVYRRISTTGNDRILDVKRAIAGGFPVCFGCAVDNAFTHGNFDPAEPLMPPRADIAGGHAMTIIGYSGDVFRVLNSWSSDFGVDGRVYFSPEYVMEAQDLWIVEHAPVEGEK
jgi:C1A family cysteine protease